LKRIQVKKSGNIVKFCEVIKPKMKPGLHNKIISNKKFYSPGVFLLVSLFLINSMEGPGQCVNPPTITLSNTSGSTCGLNSVTVSGNSFGGGATKVTLTENGDGSLTPTSASSLPFAFTYTPKSKDIGKTIIITVTTNIPAGSHCSAAKATYSLAVNAIASAPLVGTITQTKCAVATGSVVLNGLPSGGIWTLTQAPGGKTSTGTGTSTTISGLEAGTFAYTVANAEGCMSVVSANVVISVQSSTPAAPVVGTIIQPTCTVSIGSVLLSGLPATGTWILSRYPGTIISEGTGTNVTISGLAGGMYNYTVTNSTGCVSGLSANVIISSQPANLSAPLVGTITQPTNGFPTGSVDLNGLPESGSWILTRSPGGLTMSGIGINKTITGLASGIYTFTVTNASGCTSGSSANVVINTTQGALLFVVKDPSPVCFPSTVDITAPEITAGSSADLTYTYWTDTTATMPYRTPSNAMAGTYYIKGTTTAGFFSVKPVLVTVDQISLANAGADQFLEYIFETTMNAELAHNYETGMWSVISGTGVFSDSSYARTSVEGLSIGENKFLWAVTNGVCPESRDTAMIIVHDLIIKTLITPNMDGRNDYFVLEGLSTLGKTELIIFDRRGVQVYKNENYDNLWNGVDYKGNPLPEDTYFCIIKTVSGKKINGYIVIRR
jgi:gliding motility-associated-like protein